MPWLFRHCSARHVSGTNEVEKATGICDIAQRMSHFKGNLSQFNFVYESDERRRWNGNESLKVSSSDIRKRKWEKEREGGRKGRVEREEKLPRLLCKIASTASKFRALQASDSPRAFGLQAYNLFTATFNFFRLECGGILLRYFTQVKSLHNKEEIRCLFSRGKA